MMAMWQCVSTTAKLEGAAVESTLVFGFVIVGPGVPMHGVVLKPNGFGAHGLVDPITLGLLLAGLSFGDLVACNENLTGVGLDQEPISHLGVAVICDLIV